MNKNDQEFLVQKIRSRYTETEPQPTALDELKKLDRKVRRPASVFAYVYGSVSALIMGTGMSLVLSDLAQKLHLADPMLYGVVIGVVGMLMVISNYPMYKAILRSRCRKYADQILALSDTLTDNK